MDVLFARVKPIHAHVIAETPVVILTECSTGALLAAAKTLPSSKPIIFFRKWCMHLKYIL